MLSELEKNGPSAAELARAKRRILVGALSSLELLNGPGGDSGRAGLLQRFDQYTGDPGYLPKWLAQIEQVSEQGRAARDQAVAAARSARGGRSPKPRPARPRRRDDAIGARDPRGKRVHRAWALAALLGSACASATRRPLRRAQPAARAPPHRPRRIRNRFASLRPNRGRTRRCNFRPPASRRSRTASR